MSGNGKSEPKPADLFEKPYVAGVAAIFTPDGNLEFMLMGEPKATILLSDLLHQHAMRALFAAQAVEEAREKAKNKPLIYRAGNG